MSMGGSIQISVKENVLILAENMAKGVKAFRILWDI